MKKENFLDYLFDINPSPEELKDGTIRKQIGDFFNARTSTVTRNHGIYVHTSGAICDKIFFVEKGVLRGFRFDQKKREHTVFLWNEKAMATDVSSFLLRRSSDIYIQVLADAVITAITYNEVVDLIHKFPFMEPFLGTLMDSEHLYSHKRFNANGLTVKENFNELRSSFPHIELAVSKGHIASYLGISRRHFQRLTRD
jgi:hypothetical protein